MEKKNSTVPRFDRVFLREIPIVGTGDGDSGTRGWKAATIFWRLRDVETRSEIVMMFAAVQGLSATGGPYLPGPQLRPAPAVPRGSSSGRWPAPLGGPSLARTSRKPHGPASPSRATVEEPRLASAPRASVSTPSQQRARGKEKTESTKQTLQRIVPWAYRSDGSVGIAQRCPEGRGGVASAVISPSPFLQASISISNICRTTVVHGNVWIFSSSC